eukprot:TRINITY_DN4641_c0_g1_i12.p1 TRINITY_DN4641_c0_g1~~TRINITY_DN4641_c0_g1_i12.p1  ORF type:complete len:218 (-),score=42.90 TRINITY_DN4641_c0_g1_i12:201-854(-)
MGKLYSSFRVIKVEAGSPAAALPLEPMLDFLVYTPTKSDHKSFEDYITWNEGKEIELCFCNVASQKMWKAKVTPRKWNGKDLLGLDLREENYKSAHTKVIRILSVLPNSPLRKAGFHALTDYVIGTSKEVFQDLSGFTKFIKANHDSAIDFFVYSSKAGRVRVLTLFPKSDWGGEGLLGGEIGFGHLHSLPIRKAEGSGKDTIELNETDKFLDEKEV